MPDDTEKLSFEELNNEIREFLDGLADKESATEALRKVRDAQDKVKSITRSTTRASLARAGRDGFEIRDGVVREPQPSDTPDEVILSQPILSASAEERQRARDVQAKLLPTEVPECPGVEIATFSRSSRDVGGDYFDFVSGPGGRVGIVIADVSGKGVPAAMVMVMFRSIFRMVAANTRKPAEALALTNQMLSRDLLRGMFVTALYAVINPPARTMTFVNAGHHPPIIWRPRLSGTRAIDIRGPAIGLLDADHFTQQLKQKALTIEPGDCLCLYTDGVTEAKNLLGEEFDERALARALRDCARRPAEAIVKELIAAVDNHQQDAPQHDDMTLIILRAKQQ